MNEGGDIFKYAEGLLEGLDMSGWSESVGDMGGSVAEMLRKALSGEMGLTPAQSAELALRAFFSGITSSFWVIMQIMVLAVLGAVAAKAPGKPGAVRFVSIAVSGAVCLRAFYSAMSTVTSFINTSSVIIEAVFPLLSSLLAVSGAGSTSALFAPSFAVLMEGGAVVVRTAALPMAFMSAALCVSGEMFSRGALGSMGALLRKASIWVVGGYMTLMTGCAALNAAAAASFDSVTLRAAKYAMDSAIPYVGGMMSDMAGVMASGAYLVRGAVGVVGIISLCLVLMRPLGALAGLYTAMCLAAAACGACESPLEGVATATAKSVGVFTAICCMVFVASTVLLGIGFAASSAVMAAR